MASASTDSLTGEVMEKNPDLHLAQMKFKLSLPEYEDDKELKNKLIEEITNNCMAPWYERVCKDLKWNLDNILLTEMKTENDEKLQAIEDEISEAEKLYTDVEVRNAILKKAKYLSKICDEEKALESLQIAFEKTVPTTHRIEICLHFIRLGLFFTNHQVITKNLEIAEKLIDEGGNWDLRNKLKVYKGLYKMTIRKFQDASDLFLETISTFMSPEILDYDQFIQYTILSSMVTLRRTDMKEKIVRNPEILSNLHKERRLKKFIFALYECHYGDFFMNLAKLEQDLKADFFFNPHYRFYVREMKIKAYSQLLESYNSLSLNFMAKQFGVTRKYIDDDLSKYIACGRIFYKIDKVGGVVQTTRTDHKSSQFQLVARHGDLLLNRVQKLSRVINI